MIVDGAAVDGEVEAGSVRVNNRTQFDVQFGGICQVCNGGWMRELDEAAEDAVIGLGTRQTRAIRTDDVLPVAASLYRAALMGLWGSRQRNGVPLARYAEFYRDRLPPRNGVSIWIGDAEQVFDMAGGWHARLGIPGDDGKPDPDTFTWFSSWGGIGWLWVCVVVTQSGMEPVLKQFDAAITQRAQGRVKRIWPHSRRGPVELGPQLSHDVAELIAQPFALLTGKNRRNWSDYVPEDLERRLSKNGGDLSPLVRPRTREFLRRSIWSK